VFESFLTVIDSKKAWSFFLMVAAFQQVILSPKCFQGKHFECKLICVYINMAYAGNVCAKKEAKIWQKL